MLKNQHPKDLNSNPTQTESEKIFIYNKIWTRIFRTDTLAIVQSKLGASGHVTKKEWATVWDFTWKKYFWLWWDTQSLNYKIGNNIFQTNFRASSSRGGRAV
jgi:hypothetical protein